LLCSGLARAASALRQQAPAIQQSALLSLPAHLRASTAPRIPSPLGRGTPSKPQPKQSFPVRTSKLTQKHVLLPEEIQTRPLGSANVPTTPPPRYSSTSESNTGTSTTYDEHERTDAEKMSKSQRQEAGLPRLTAYATAESYRIKLLQAFLKREHGVGVVRVFDDAVYAVSPGVSMIQRTHCTLSPDDCLLMLCRFIHFHFCRDMVPAPKSDRLLPSSRLVGFLCWSE
jgi:hypothetical protein